MNFTSPLLQLAASALKYTSFKKNVSCFYLAVLLFKNTSPLQFLPAPAGDNFYSLPDKQI